MDAVTAIILAAGEGKRMRSRQPKILHRLCGRPLVGYPLRLARTFADRVVMVVPPSADGVAQVAGEGVLTVVQRERLGTGHAVVQAKDACGEGTILGLTGDMPLLTVETIERLLNHHKAASAAATLLTAIVVNHAGYGRVLRQRCRVARIVAVRYATVDWKKSTEIGSECVIGAGSHVSGSRLADRVVLKPYSIIEEAAIDEDATLGPFCHLRPGCHIGAGAEIGNFAELKKSRVGKKTKIHHVSYMGDATLGERVNVGAGTITCNYDGQRKHPTVIGDGVFVGTNSSLVAPLTIGEGAYVAAGSVITRDVPPGALALERSPQVVKDGWAAKRKSNTRKGD